MYIDDTCRCEISLWLQKPSGKVVCNSCGGSPPVPRVVPERP